MAAFIYKQYNCARTVFCLAIMAVFLAFPVMAQTTPNESYTVEGVEVDVTAKNAVEAREKAFMDAQVKAYEMLAQRLLPADQFATFKAPDANTVSMMVQDFEVTNEQLSRVRYKGTYTVRFRPSSVRAQLGGTGALQQAGTTATQQGLPKPILVLPFFQNAYTSVLWGEGNPWMSAWRNMPTDRSMMQPTVLPLGDAADFSKVSDNQALTYNPTRVQELAARYNAEEAMVVLASRQGRGIAVNLYKHGFEGPRFVQKLVIDPQPSETDQALFARAAVQVKALIRQEWMNKQQQPSSQTVVQQTTVQQRTPPVPYTRQARGPATTYNTHAKFANVQDWVRIKNALDRVPGVQGVIVKTLKSREALLDIRFEGNINQLQPALQNAGIIMRATSVNAPIEIYMNASPLSQYR